MIGSLFTSFIATKLGKLLPSWAWEIVLIGLLVLAGALFHHVQVVKHDDGVRAEQKAKDQKALDQTVANYRAAATRAEADDKAKNDHVKAETAANDKETIDELQARIAAARAEYQRLQHAARPANPGSPAGPGVSSIPAAPGGPVEAAPDGLSLDDRLLCTEQSIQLDELISWNQRQHAVDPNAKPQP